MAGNFKNNPEFVGKTRAAHKNRTKSQESSDSLAWHRAELRAIYRNIPVMLCTLDESRRVLYANRAFCKFTGVRERELINGRACGVFGCINANDSPLGCGFGPKCSECPILGALEDTLKSGRKHTNVEWEATLEQRGTRRQIVVLGSTVRISARGNRRILLCLQDITERKRTEQAFLESEARLRATFEHSIAGILLTSPDGRVFAANPAACRMLGRTEEDICRVGRAHVTDKKDPQLDALLRERAEKGYAEGEMILVRADGRRFPIQVASAIFETKEGLRTSVVFLDISENKLAEEHIRHFSQKLLSVREEEKQHLSAVLHHEVGSSTVGIMARLNAAEDDLRKGKQKQALASLKECRALFAQAAKNLKKLAVELRPPDLDLLGLRASLRQHFEKITRETSLKIHFIDATRSKAICSEVQTFLFRAAQECINNVIKHAGARHAQVRLSVARQQIQMSIADDGKGFDPDRSASKPDLHMGLRAIQEMAAALGGRVKIESKSGNGTKVTVIVPRRGKGK
jgi:PAS domain S-box-containing protein